MHILAFIIFAVIILAIVTIAHGYHWLSIQRLDYLYSPVPSAVIRTYDVHTIKDGFNYTNNLDWVMRYAPDGKHNYLPGDRLEYEKKRVAEKMGRYLLQNGFIQVAEKDSTYNPFLKEVHFLLRVYKEGEVEETWKTNVTREEDEYANGYPSYGDPDYPAGP